MEEQEKNEQEKGDEQQQEVEKKRKNSRQIGMALIVLSGLYGATAAGVAQQASSNWETAGAYSVPLVTSLLGLYFFFKGGGKIA